VEIEETSAEVRERDVLLRWRTSLDVRNVSFHVYRKDAGEFGDGIGVRLTREPLTSRNGEYEFVDTGVRSNHNYEYRLEMTGDPSGPLIRTIPVHVGHLRWSFAIRVVRPQPASGPLTIAFELPDRGRASLDVVDVGGRRVQRMLEAELDEGAHEANLDLRRMGEAGRPLATGVYFAVLRFNGRTEAKRIIVME
jgi:hypothetical protein